MTDSGGSADAGVQAILTLADWRRTVATMYADVRRLAATDPGVALDHWRATRERLYREHPQSPVPAERRDAFRAIHFEHDPALRFELPIETVADPLAATAGPGLPSMAIDFGSGDSGAGAAAATSAAAPARAGAVELPVSGGGVMA